MSQTDLLFNVVPVGTAALSSLVQTVADVQASDPFARVVIITDHRDVAQSVRHRLGVSGTVNVAVQTGRHLAKELADPVGKQLPRTLETQAVRLVAEPDANRLGFGSAGCRRFYRSLTAAFREMAERPDLADVAPIDEPDDMRLLAERLYGDYRTLVDARGYYLPTELASMAVEALNDRWEPGREPAVIYYLPRRLSVADTELARALLDRGKCRVIAGLVGDDDADAPVLKLLELLDGPAAVEASNVPDADPLHLKTDADSLSIVVAPDPEEEVRSVIRSIAADDRPFHRIAVVYRQDNPYGSLLRQEFDFAGVPYTGVDYRRLADTPGGRVLLGLTDLAAELNGPGRTIDRERLIEWFTSAPVRWQRETAEAEDPPRPRTAPAAAWANLARNARSGGTVQNWRERLSVYVAQMEPQADAASGGDDNPFMERLRQQVRELLHFVEQLAAHLSSLGRADNVGWDFASQRLQELVTAYRWVVPGEAEEDLRRIDEVAGGFSSLGDWGVEYSPEALREAVREGLQSPVSERGRQVGNGVYMGPPAGIAGADYDVVYVLGMVERQFPPRPHRSPWLAQSQSDLDRLASLERYDFMAAVAAGQKAVLSWPSATAERSAAYPSRWLIEAANRRHQQAGAADRLTYENLVDNLEAKPWLTYIRSREGGLRALASPDIEPADSADYNLMHLVAQPRDSRRHHPAIASHLRMSQALNARDARNGGALSQWEGRVEVDIPAIASIGTRERPVSPSALETWATCPHKFFLSRVLRLAALPGEEEEDAMSPLERGALVHRILERFVEEGAQADADLLSLAEEEFLVAAQRGVTGYPLLWDMTKEDVRESLQRFADHEMEWLTGVPSESVAEEGFGPGTEIGEVGFNVEGLGEVWFRGKIDRVDVIGNEVRVRDFKTGRPEPYFDGSRGRKATRTLANGRALQLPVYAAAARQKYPDNQFSITASYCFPLAENNIHGVAPYTEADREAFSATLVAIVDAARRGIFPATPETAGDSSQERGNCTYCEFNRLCPVRRRQAWERKGLTDAETVQPFNSLGSKAAIGADDDED